MEDGISVFDVLGPVAEKRSATVLQKVFIIILLAVAVFYTVVGCYGFWSMARLSYLIDTYDSKIFNPLTLPYFVTAIIGLTAIITGVIFILKRWYKSCILILVSGILTSMFLFYIN